MEKINRLLRGRVDLGSLLALCMDELWKTFAVKILAQTVVAFGEQIFQRFLPATSRAGLPGDHLGTDRLLFVASFGRLLYSLVGLLRNDDDDEDDEDE